MYGYTQQSTDIHWAELRLRFCNCYKPKYFHFPLVPLKFLNKKYDHRPHMTSTLLIAMDLRKMYTNLMVSFYQFKLIFHTM